MNGREAEAMAEQGDTPESPAEHIGTESRRAALPTGRYELAAMVERITVENLHPEVDFGKPEGEEQ